MNSSDSAREKVAISSRYSTVVSHTVAHVEAMLPENSPPLLTETQREGDNRE